MDIDKVLSELRQELARIDEAICALERLQQGLPRRGRPPGWLSLVPKPRRPVRKEKTAAVDGHP